MRNDNMGVFSFVDKPTYGATEDGFNTETFEILPVGRTATSVFPFNEN